jgi:hypothetical protein
MKMSDLHPRSAVYVLRWRQAALRCDELERGSRFHAVIALDQLSTHRAAPTICARRVGNACLLQSAGTVRVGERVPCNRPIVCKHAPLTPRWSAASRHSCRRACVPTDRGDSTHKLCTSVNLSTVIATLESNRSLRRATGNSAWAFQNSRSGHNRHNESHSTNSTPTCKGMPSSFGCEKAGFWERGAYRRKRIRAPCLPQFRWTPQANLTGS